MIRSPADPMRLLTDHIVDADAPQNQLRVTANDEPGAGGACHAYAVTGFSGNLNPSLPHGMDGLYEGALVLFQNGPIKAAGLNGVTHESLLAIIIDRLRSFQTGPYPTRENALALTNCEIALMWLQKRTRDRISRGVEGTPQA
jgi:hypothetical protein